MISCNLLQARVKFFFHTVNLEPSFKKQLIVAASEINVSMVGGRNQEGGRKMRLLRNKFFVGSRKAFYSLIAIGYITFETIFISYFEKSMRCLYTIQSRRAIFTHLNRLRLVKLVCLEYQSDLLQITFFVIAVTITITPRNVIAITITFSEKVSYCK